MRGLVIKGPGTFGETSNMDKIGVSPVPAIPGAMLDWAADNTRLGSTKAWWDMITGKALTTDRAEDLWPRSIQATNRYIGFDGVNDMLEADINMTGAKTTILVARLPTPAAGQVLIASSTTESHNLYAGGSNIYAFTTGAGNTLLSGKTVDTLWHCFIITTLNGVCTIRVDGQEWQTTGTASAATKLRLGATTGVFNKVDVSRFAVLPYAAGDVERTAIQTILKKQYGLL